MTTDHEQTVRQFIAALGTGELPDAITTSDMTAWTLSGGAADKARFAGGVALLQRLFPAGYTYEVDAVMVDGDRAAAEVHAAGVFADGQDFANDYVFTFRLRDGRIAAVREYANVLLVREQIMPRLQAIMASGS